jgi:hypothetical protein
VTTREEYVTMPVIDDGLVMDNLEETTQAEIEAHLIRLWRNRGPLYAMSSISIMLDNRPDFAKLHRRGAAMFGRPSPPDELVGGLGNLHAYIHLGFEPGILNEVRNRQRQGISKSQFLDLFMMAQLSAGIRGLQHIYNAVGTLLPDFQNRPVSPPFPEGWAPDADAFKAGLDLSTPELTSQDREAIEAWYLATIGEVPRSVRFAAKHHPTYLKGYRAKWEAAFRGGLPKQMMPYLMLRHNTNNALKDGIRESALLGKAWGMSKMWVIKAVTQSGYYFTGLEALSVAEEALAPVLDNWE